MTLNQEGFPRILVIAVWFGPLPSWFPLWANSCRWNSDLDWLLATDAENLPADMPENVHIVKVTMGDVARRVSEFADVLVQFESPYKACDYRPLFACLVDLVPGKWDFWGHCDLDMLFGNVRSFLSPAILSNHDRIFGQGHFSLYRNDAETNRFYSRQHPNLDYREILSDARHRGFDEHRGVNRIWHLHGGRFYENESVVADIDPHTQQLRRISTADPVTNNRKQAFGYKHGRVFRNYVQGQRLMTQEFMYLHFQKRTFTLPAPAANWDAVWLTPRGFIPMDDQSVTGSRLQDLNPAPLVPTAGEVLYRSRGFIRSLRRRARGPAS